MKALFSYFIKFSLYLFRLFDLYIICLGHKNVYLRKNGTQIGRNCTIITKVENFSSEPYLIKIGNDVTITDGVKLITHDASTRLFRSHHPEMNKRYGNLFGTIIIGNNCFIGVNAILLYGTFIGDNCIIGAGSIVKGTFPDNSVIVGVPARRVSPLDEYIEKVKNKMIPLTAETRSNLREELIQHFSKELL